MSTAADLDKYNHLWKQRDMYRFRRLLLGKLIVRGFTCNVIDLMVLGVAPVYASYKGMLTMRQHTVCSNAIGTKRYIRFLSHPIGADSA